MLVGGWLCMLYAICHSVGWPTVGSLKNKGGEMDNLSAFEAQALILKKNCNYRFDNPS